MSIHRSFIRSAQHFVLYCLVGSSHTLPINLSTMSLSAVSPAASHKLPGAVRRPEGTTTPVPGSPVLKEQAMQESIERMKANLSRFARVSNKRMALRTLNDCIYLRAIPLDTTPSLPSNRDELAQLEEEVCQSNIQLNGLLFTGSANSQILKVLRALCQELCKGLRVSSETIYMAMIVRLANSSNSADSYFQLNALMGSQDLVLKPRLEHHASRHDPIDIPPTDLHLYEANGQIHAIMTSATAYGLFRRSDVKSGKPWISLLGQVHERVNMTTGASVRQVYTKITTPDNQK